MGYPRRAILADPRRVNLDGSFMYDKCQQVAQLNFRGTVVIYKSGYIN